MIAHHRVLFKFDHWASWETLAAIEPVAMPAPRAVAWMAHVMAAKRLWYARTTGADAPFPVNPILSLDDIRTHLQVARDEWAAYLESLADTDLDRVVSYTNTAGTPFTSTLGAVLTHVPLHGQHHRGQAATEVRRVGGTPPVIDFIHATRRGLL